MRRVLLAIVVLATAILCSAAAQDATPSFEFLSYPTASGVQQPWQVVYDTGRPEEDNPGQDNGAANPGETVQFVIGLRNTSDRDYLSLSAFIEIPEAVEPYIEVIDDEIVFDEILAQKDARAPRGDAFAIRLSKDLPAEMRTIPVRVLLWDSEFGKEYQELSLGVEPIPDLDFGQVTFDDDRPGPSDGDGDGVPESGETIELRVGIRNTGAVDVVGANGGKIRAVLGVDEETEALGIIAFSQNVLEYGQIPAGAERPTAADYDFTIAPFGGSRKVVFTVHLENCAANGYQYSWVRTYEQIVSGGPPRIVGIFKRARLAPTFHIEGRQLDAGCVVVVDGQVVPATFDGVGLVFGLPAGAEQGRYEVVVRSSDGQASDAYTFDPAEVETREFFVSDFEAGLGPWEATGGQTIWHWSQTRAASGTGCARAAVPGDDSYGDDAETRLTSPVLNLTVLSSPVLTFSHAIDGEPDYDFLHVDVSTDGGDDWTEIFQSAEDTGTAWSQVELDLSSYRSAEFRVRFRFTSDESNTGQGYFLDDVTITSRRPVVLQAYRPFGTEGIVAVRGEDFGPDAVVLVDGREVETTRRGLGLAFDLPAGAEQGRCQVVVRNADGGTSEAFDFDPTRVAESEFFESRFEDGLGPWVATGDETIWHWSQDRAATGTGCARAAVPGDDSYADDADTRLTSPLLDLTVLSAPVLTFSHAMAGEPDYDFLHVDVSTDGGNDWTEIFTSDEDMGSGWSEVELDLAGCQSARFRVRFRFTSDESNTGAGHFLDDITISSRRPVILSAYRPFGTEGIVAIRGESFGQEATVLVDGREVEAVRRGVGLSFGLPARSGPYQVVVRNAGGEVSEAFTLDPAEVGTGQFFESDFENGLGPWEASGGLTEWHWSQARAATGAGSARAAVPGGSSYTNDADTRLTSPVLDLTELSTPILKFSHAMRGEPDFDFLHVEVSTDGGDDWIEIFESDEEMGTGWSDVELDLTRYRSAQFRMRFRFTSDESNTGEGHFLDDVVISAQRPVVLEAYRPFGAEDIVAIRGEGFGPDAVVLMNGREVETTRRGAGLAFSLPGGTGEGPLQVAVRNGDGETSEAFAFDPAQIQTSEFFESHFEDGLGPWTATGDETIWHFSQARAATGTGCVRAAVPGDDSYSDDADARLTSPVLDLTALSSPVLTFSHAMRGEPDYDFLHVEVSTDGGNEWTEIFESDEDMGSGWSDQRLSLTRYRSAQFRLRFRFTSDESNTGEGHFLDDVVISERQPQEPRQTPSGSGTIRGIPGANRK